MDSPIGLNGLGGKANGIPNTSTTAKLTDMMPLYRPTKVSYVFQLDLQRLTIARSCFVGRRRRQGAQVLYYPLILTMKEACCLPQRVITACKFTTSRRERITRLCSVRNMVLCTLCLPMPLALSFIPVPKSIVSVTGPKLQ